jgi:hypothetical protein
MKQAMNTLCQFSEKERHYFAYQARQSWSNSNDQTITRKRKLTKRFL